MRKKKKIKILVVIVLVILILLMVFVGRNISIISNLSKNAEKTISSINYHQVIYTYNLGDYNKEEIFNLEDRKKIILTQVDGNNISTVTMYANKLSDSNNSQSTYSVNLYAESKEGKRAKLNEKIGFFKDLNNQFETENWWELFKASVFANIKEETFNGKECYYISNFNGPYSETTEGMYVEKDTGLPISVMGYEILNASEVSTDTKKRSPIYEYTYEFNTVTEEDFVEPNVSEYEVED